MAYDEYLADRVGHALQEKGVDFYVKKMFGGLCYMVDEKMCCGILHIKAKAADVLMARIGEDAYPEAILKSGAMPMDFTGRTMRGYVFVTMEGVDTDDELAYWIQLCIDFNPIAKSSNTI